MPLHFLKENCYTKYTRSASLVPTAESGPPNALTPARGRGYPSELFDHLLVAYKIGPCEPRTQWIGKLMRECSQAAANQRLERQRQFEEQTICKEAMVALIDQIFDLLQAYSLEFNISVGWDLHIGYTKPALVTEVLRSTVLREPLESVTTYRARIAARSWSLILRGCNNVIDVIFMPSCKVIGLYKAEQAYEPHAQLRAALSNGKAHWEIKGAPFLAEDLPEFCMEMFSELVRLASGRQTDNQWAAVTVKNVPVADQAGQSELKPGAQRSNVHESMNLFQSALANSAQATGGRTWPLALWKESLYFASNAGWEALTVQYMYNQAQQVNGRIASGQDLDNNQQIDIHARTVIDGNPAAGASQPEDSATVNVTYYQPENQALAVEQQFDGQTNKPQDFQAPEKDPAKVIEVLQKLSNMVASTVNIDQADDLPDTLRQSNAPDFSSLIQTDNTGGKPNMIEYDTNAIAQAIAALSAQIDNQIHRLTKAGAEAFLSREFTRVDAYRAQAIQLGQFHDQVADLTNVWQEMVPEQTKPVGNLVRVA